MEYPITLAIFSGFFCNKEGLIKTKLSKLKYKNYLKIVIILFMLILIFYKGLQQRGTYEVTPDEKNGVLKWRGFAEIRKLLEGRTGLRAAITEHDRIYFVLDIGSKLKKLDVLHNNQDVKNIQSDNYDIILLNREADNHYDNDYSGMKKIQLDDSRVIFIRG